jgi:hypothetical protein
LQELPAQPAVEQAAWAAAALRMAAAGRPLPVARPWVRAEDEARPPVRRVARRAARARAASPRAVEVAPAVRQAAAARVGRARPAAVPSLAVEVRPPAPGWRWCARQARGWCADAPVEHDRDGRRRTLGDAPAMARCQPLAPLGHPSRVRERSRESCTQHRHPQDRSGFLQADPQRVILLP